MYSSVKKEYRENNLDIVREGRRRHYLENAEALREKARNFCKDNPDICKMYRRNRRARVRNAEGTFDKAHVDKLYALQRGLCPYCECDLSEGYHADHIMPLALGGSNWPENIQLLCPTCNLRKHAKDPFKWANELGKLL